ncbi:ElyC/SanA/YdcF family protein [Kitasatospora sp. CM 4170]|uniref:Vancomycin high temperature exclusion protein n=1 Tax=Kitasatospora aburaviensis TaxID=67265 RepID=A0ABW1F0F8_9ACTN|nr:ElyC/SanA/YdcF family protein [Kitasatospora sp. CM 4170]WNM48903.1 ElyC/SanA/YdcF family protein [Kitasatospora sp. CM 4170]
MIDLTVRRARRLGVRLRQRRTQRRLFQLVTAGCALALAPSAWLWIAAGDRVGTVASAPSAPVAVVFGAGLFDGKPSPYLAHRLDAAVDLYRAQKVQAILVTGDNGRDSYDETDAMRDYLIEHGVPRIRVVGDYAGFDTWDSCTRAHRIFGVDRAVLVSQDFHVRRALALCEAAGIDSYAVGVPEWRDATWLYGGVREIPGAGKAALNVLMRPDPLFLGPKEEGIPRALADAAAARL